LLQIVQKSTFVVRVCTEDQLVKLCDCPPTSAMNVVMPMPSNNNHNNNKNRMMSTTTTTTTGRNPVNRRSSGSIQHDQ
jgi:hypothetical protein